MKGVTVGYTGWFGWPAVYCRILEIDGDRLRVELLEGGEGWIRATDFTPKYFFKSLPNMLSAQGGRMTDEELSKLIAEFLPYPSKNQHYALRSFAKLVAEAEREACAKVCGDMLAMTKYEKIPQEVRFALDEAENAIRARGQG